MRKEREVSGHKDMQRYGKCCGSVTVGERGQVVIPAEARNNLDIKAGGKLIVFSGFGMSSLTLVKAEAITEFVAKAMEHLSKVKEAIKEEE
jgi:AbrB family looped-hinge helix DNA binding protein